MTTSQSDKATRGVAPTFKPSEVTPCGRVKPQRASSFLPFVAGFDKCEREVAAALLVRVCEARGDVWAPVSWKDAQAVLKEDMAAKRKPWSEWMQNPFVKPDVWGLVEGGFARWSDAEGESLVFTDKGFDVLGNFVAEKPKTGLGVHSPTGPDGPRGG